MLLIVQAVVLEWKKTVDVMRCIVKDAVYIGAGSVESISTRVAEAGTTTLTRLRVCLGAEDNNTQLRATFVRCSFRSSSCQFYR